MNFRINSIIIEGFKGFTSRQTIPVNGKNLFIFGPNGYGKSSIVEAVRWCLFGLTGRPEEIVRNQFYNGDCFVELELRDENNNLWKVQRVLSPGAERSRLKILDPSGNEKTQANVFPFLTSLGPREGTYIVFGGPSQLPSRKRPLESIEISDFGTTIYAYLRLEELPELIERLKNLIEEQKEEEKRLEEEIEEERKKIKSELEEVIRQMSLILTNPPWKESEPPTLEQTKQKIKNLTSQLGEEVKKSFPTDLKEDELLNIAKEWLQELRAPSEGELRRRILEIKEKQKKVSELKSGLEKVEGEIKNIEEEMKGIKKEIKEKLDNRELDDLKKELEETERKIEQKSLLAEIMKKSEMYLRNNVIGECFVCLSQINEEEVIKNIEENLSKIESDSLQIIQYRDELKKTIEEVTQRGDKLKKMTEMVQQLQTHCQEIKRSLYEVSGIEGEVNSEKIKILLDSLESREKELEKSLESKEEYHRVWERRIKELEEEVRFHRLRKKSEKLETRLQIGLKPVEESFAELVEFRESLEDIRNALYFVLKEVLEEVLPKISKLMTEVYKHLTNQLSFDTIMLELEQKDDELSPRLLVRVASSEEPDLPSLDPEQVLNGQALNALRLVPYFVFSRFQRERWGLDLLLLDDPTQSFDVQRIESLLEELGVATTHAQIMLSTHEEDRFSPNLFKFFERENVALINVKGFDRKNGPKIEF
jgi:DNA repair exonuclease SbcCD ATPase subunit